jgi:catechol 2,3-dioxygenase-like lactoylglutathione lyase family enzyme
LKDTESGHQPPEDARSASVASCVVRVADLDRSLRFYCDVFSCRVVSHESDMALLLTPRGFQIYLHELSGFQRRAVRGGPGVQYAMWATDSQTELQRIADRLRRYDSSVYSHTVGGLAIIEGSDPDKCRVIVAYPSPHLLPRTVIADRLRY